MDRGWNLNNSTWCVLRWFSVLLDDIDIFHDDPLFVEDHLNHIALSCLYLILK